MKLMNMTSTMTMSSLEIAKLTGKDHKNVLADVRKMLEELEITDLNFQGSYKDSMTSKCLLDKELTEQKSKVYR